MSGVLSLGLAGRPEQRFECSRAGCRAEAGRAILWRNPKIHAEHRVKTWLACDEHIDELHGFLAARGFPITVVPVTELPTSDEEGHAR